MTTSFKRPSLLATTLAFGLLAALQLPQALAGNKGDEYRDKPRPSSAAIPATPAQKAQPNAQGDLRNKGQMGMEKMSPSGMEHHNMDHDRAMQQMHQNHGQMNHGSMPPAKAEPKAKDRKNGQ